MHKQNWRPYRRFTSQQVPNNALDWLLDPSSLTQRLKNSCQSSGFRVVVLQQQYQYLGLDEARILHTHVGARVLIREVHLLCDGVPWVYARTLIPESTFTGRMRRLKYQGSKPLGETIFSDSSMRRGHLEITSAWESDIPGIENERNRQLWGRRSVFYIQAQPLLVAEYYLPSLLDACK